MQFPRSTLQLDIVESVLQVQPASMSSILQREIEEAGLEEERLVRPSRAGRPTPPHTADLRRSLCARQELRHVHSLLAKAEPCEHCL